MNSRIRSAHFDDEVMISSWIQLIAFLSLGPSVQMGPKPPTIFACKASATGALDSSFGTTGAVVAGIESPNELLGINVIQHEDRIFISANDGTDTKVVAFNTDGTVDLSFGTIGTATVPSLIGSGLAVHPLEDYLLLGGTHSGSARVVAISHTDPPPPPPPDSFSDDDDSLFEADIVWLATAGITKGCNAPVTSSVPMAR